MWGHQEARAQRKGSDQDRKAALSIRSWSLEKKADEEGRWDEGDKGEKELDKCGKSYNAISS